MRACNLRAARRHVGNAEKLSQRRRNCVMRVARPPNHVDLSVYDHPREEDEYKYMFTEEDIPPYDNEWEKLWPYVSRAQYEEGIKAVVGMRWIDPALYGYDKVEAIAAYLHYRYHP